MLEVIFNLWDLESENPGLCCHLLLSKFWVFSSPKSGVMIVMIIVTTITLTTVCSKEGSKQFFYMRISVVKKIEIHIIFMTSGGMTRS